MKTSQFNFLRLVSCYLIAAFVLVSAGCSSRPPSSADPTLALSDNGGEQAIITFAGSEYQRQFFEALMETFHEQNPDITIQFVDLFQFFSGEEGYNPLNTFRKMAQAADTVLIQAPFIWDESIDMSRYFRNLQPLYESDPSFQPDDFWPGVLSSCEDTYGNMAGLPLTAPFTGVFYDEAAFDAAGIPHPKPGWTWDDFQRTIVALADERGGEIKFGFYDQPDLGISILAPVVSYHLQVHNGEVDAAALLDEVEWYIDLAQAGMLSGVKTGEDVTYEHFDKIMQQFQDDALRPAMWADSLISWIPTTSDISPDPSNPFSGMSIDRFGFAPYPVSADGSTNQATRGLVECAAISAGSTNPRAAWAWLDFLSRQWIVMDKTQVYELNRAPTRKSVAESVGYWDLLPAKAVPAVRYALEHGTYGFAYPEPFMEINLALAKTISENADFAQVLEAAIAARPETTPLPLDNTPIVVATPRAPLPEGVTGIKYYISAYNPNEFNAIRALIEQFNQRSPDVQVNLILDFMGNWEEYWINNMANNFDCFTGDAPLWEEFDATSVLNLNSLMSSEPASFVNDFSPEMMDIFRHEGNLYALPASSRLQMIAYNADLLARRGLSLPANNWTFDNFVELASAAASTSDSDPGYGFLYSPYGEDDFLAAGKGIKWFDFQSNPPQVELDSPEMAEYLRWISNAQQERLIFNQENNWEKMDAVMTAGQLAFWTAVMGEKAWWFQGSDREPTYKIGMAPIPQVTGDNPMAASRIDRGHYISAQTQDPQACWEWVKFLSEQPNALAGVPARRSIVESPAWEASVGREDAAAYRAAITNLKPIESFDVYVEMMKILWPLNNWKTQSVQAALEGQEIQPVLIAQQQKAEAYLACALALDTNESIDQLNEDVQGCLRQVDPEGGW